MQNGQFFAFSLPNGHWTILNCHKGHLSLWLLTKMYMYELSLYRSIRGRSVGAISLICVRLALLCIVFVGVNLTWRCGHLKALMSAGARGAS